MDLIVLVCVVLAGLAAGVLAAYSICLGMFAAFQMHARQAAAESAAPAMVASTATATGN